MLFANSLGVKSLLELSITKSELFGSGNGISTPTTFFKLPLNAFLYNPLSSCFFKKDIGEYLKIFF